METRLNFDILEQFVCLEPEVGEELLPRYPEFLTPEECEQFELHLQGCELCQERVKLWQVSGVPLRVEAIAAQTRRLFGEKQYDAAVSLCNHAVVLNPSLLDTPEGREMVYGEPQFSLSAATVRDEDILPYFQPDVEVLAAAKKKISLPVSLEYRGLTGGKVTGRFSAAGRFVFFELLDYTTEFAHGVELIGKTLAPQTMIKRWTIHQEKKKRRLGTIAELFGNAELPDIVNSLQTFCVLPA